MRLPRANMLLLRKMIFEIVDRKLTSLSQLHLYMEGKMCLTKLSSKQKEFATFRNSPELY